MPADSLRFFSPATRAWFEAAFAEPTPAQVEGWETIAGGSHTLIHAPTGSGKTLAAFLWAIDRLHVSPVPDTASRCRVLYVSPLKALAHDVDRNLRSPLLGIRHASERLGLAPSHEVTTFLRTGDTPQNERRQMTRRPPDVLITTPESLFLILTSQARAVLASVETIIVDEIHAVAGTKRGAHLALSLERLESITSRPAQRIGLSATQRPLEVTAMFLGGGEVESNGSVSARPVTIVDVKADHPVDIEIVVPIEDMTEPAPLDPLAGPDDPVRSRSIWPAVYPRILALIEEHRSTIVFANSRRLAERVCAELNQLAGSDIARAHHGSVSRTQRLAIEEGLKRGDLKAVVATSTLELGIDMGTVDLVIQIEAPTSVASGLQRVGRAGHDVGKTSVAKIFPKYRGDLLVAAVIAEEMRLRAVESISLPNSPLDVLAQQLVAMAALDATTADELYETSRRAAPYFELSRPVFDATLDMLAGRYPSDLFAELRPRLVWDRQSGAIEARPGSRQIAIANAGTIPDRGLFRVSLPDGSRVGELDEEMVYESRVGDVFLLGSTAWRIQSIGPDRVEVTPAPGDPTAKMPFWHGDSLGRSLETGKRLGAFIREMSAIEAPVREKTLIDRYGLDRLAASNLSAYLDEELEAAGVLPSDKTIVVQRFRDEIGDWRVVILSPFGARVHAPWAMALRQRWLSGGRSDIDVIWSDDGIAFRFPDSDEVSDTAELLLDPAEIHDLLLEQMAESSLFAARFREAAARSLLLPRRRPNQRTPLWLQRRRSADLLAVARQFGDFPIVLETYREILQDDFDLPGLTNLMTQLSDRQIRLVDVETNSASPFASSLLFAFVAAFLYEADTPLAERRASALTLDRGLLAELLGDGQMADLLDPAVISALEEELQHLTRPLSGIEGVADLVRRIGPLSVTEIEARTVETDVTVAIEELRLSGRLIGVRVGGVDRWAAVEDAGRLRDALGTQVPLGVPSVFLESVSDPLGDVVGRFARTHSPFEAEVVATSLGLPIGVVNDCLKRLASDGLLIKGGFTAGHGQWVDREVLRRLKRRTLAALRAEVEAVETDTLGRFLPAWHGVTDRPPSGVRALNDALLRLRGHEMPASVFEREILGRRVRDGGSLLDEALLSGEFVWLGRGAIGPNDGRIVITRRSDIGLLPDFEPTRPERPIHDAIRSHLGGRGALFFSDLYSGIGGGDPEAVSDALWDLVWAGELTNDSMAPLRAFVDRRRRQARARGPLSSTFSPRVAGRWAMVNTPPADDTERTLDWARSLLDRHGVLTRAAMGIERLPGGFSAIYPVLSQLEDRGMLRRGYFIEGLGGAQFALPGAVDRLRNEQHGSTLLLAATDPANPFGNAISWPKVESGRLARTAGASVVLSAGALACFHHRTRLHAFADPAPATVRVLHDQATLVRTFSVETVNGQPVATSDWYRPLMEAGFVPGHRGLRAKR